MARQLRVDVIELASTVPHAQRPAYYDGVVGKYCLAGCEGEAGKELAATTKMDVAKERRTRKDGRRRSGCHPRRDTQAETSCARSSQEVCLLNPRCQWIDTNKTCRAIAA